MKGRCNVMIKKLIIVRAFDKTAENEVRNVINSLDIEVVEETTYTDLENVVIDILTLMTKEQALTMLDVTNNIDALMFKGEE